MSSSPPVSALDAATTPELDGAATLPAANSRSFAAMIAVQALNAFNDNFVKILLIAFALSVAEKTFLGENMQLLLGACFCLPYIFFAPVAGWMSDRYSKQQVIFWMQVVQVGVFGCFLGSLALHQPQTSLILSLVCFFLLATQAAFFSPAKLGIAKELVGSKRLGSASGVLQLSNFAGILSGMALAGWWFGHRLDAGMNPWQAVWFPMVCVSVLAVAQVFGSLLILRTPAHTEITFHRKIWLEHFSHLKLLFSQRPLMLAAIGVTYFWFITYTISAILVVWCHETFADKADASRALSTLSLMLGAGVIPGSFLASIICRKRLEMGLVPVAGFAMAIALFWGGLMPYSPWLHLAMVGVGMAGGAFMSPLYAFVQDRAKPEERARILSAMNLMDSIGGVIANLVVVSVMVSLGLEAGAQILILVPLALAAAVFITKLLPRSLLMIIGRTIVVAMYRLRSNHEERTPEKGSLLILPNHVSYTDALMIGGTCERKVRFVIFESIYEIKAITWALKIFGSVPISPSRAKDAVRTVADSLKAEQAVVLYPEGQLTRTGFLNQLNKGYELMARMGGNVLVQPVWIDGLWGSVFSFEQGRFFTKRPRAFRYSVSTWYGEPVPAKEATTERMREAILALGAEAFAARKAVQKTPPYARPDGRPLEAAEAQMVHLNTLRILETSLLWKEDTLLCLLPQEHPMTTSLMIGLHRERGEVTLAMDPAAAIVKEGKRLVVIGTAATLAGYEAPAGAFVVELIETSEITTAGAANPDRPKALYDAATGALLSISVPDPLMPKGEEGLQIGHRSGSLGHFIPTLSPLTEGENLVMRAIVPGKDVAVTLTKVKLDDMGFLFPIG